MDRTSAPGPRARRPALLGVGAVGAFALALALATPPSTAVGTTSGGATSAASTVTATPTVTAQGAGPSAATGPPATPTLLTSSFLGGAEWDEGADIEVDAAGSSYVTGFTLSPDLRTAGATQARFAGLADGFVTKVSADGLPLWSTYLGGADIDLPSSLALDRDGNVYVTGRTASSDFPTTPGAFQTTLRGTLCQRQVPCHDAFVTKLSPDGRLVYSTLLGGSANEEGVGIAVDRRGRAWVTGTTDSSDLPVVRPLQRRFQSPPCPGDLPCEYDVFVAALTADGSRLHFSTYLGGGAHDTAGGIAVDDRGSAYVTGTTRSADFPVSARALQRHIRGLACGPPPGEPCLDAFVTKIAGRRLAWSTYLGGSRDERSSGVAVDETGQAIVTGSTRSTDLPLRNAGQQRLGNSSCSTEVPEEQCDDAFVTQLTDDGRRLVSSTYLGGQAEDQGLAVDVDTSGNTFVAGRTDSRDFPVLQATQRAFGGYIDGFVAELAQGSGRVVRSTFVGGSKADRVTGVDTHPSGSVHLTGRTLSPDFPTVSPFQPALGKADEYDAFVQVLR